MKYCQKCGKELLDEAVICPNCGCAVAPVQPSSPTESPFATETPQPQSRESDSSANMALLFAFLGVINMGKYQTKKYKDRCVAAIVIGAIVQIIMILLVMNIY